MIRENQKYLNRTQILLDLSMILVAFLGAHFLRFNVLDSGQLSLSFAESLFPIVCIIPVYLLLYNVFDLYSARRTKPLHREISAIIKVNLISAILLMTCLFVFKLINFSRLMLLIFFTLNTGLTAGSRIAIRLLLKKYRKRGYNQKHCLVVGATNSSVAFIEKVHKNPHWGYKITGILKNSPSNKQTFMDYPILGDYSKLDSLLEAKHIDIVIIAVSGNDLIELGQILHSCEKAGVKTNIIPYYHKYIPAKPYMDDLDGLPVIDIRHVPLDNVFKNFAKRLFDIAFALAAILLTSPLMLLSVIMIKLTSPGPIIFKQERVGRDRRNFYMYKFRSMKVQTDAEEKAQWTTKDDPRKTRWGSFMRRTSIDELPQFFNVLLGDMSVVGPRPERPYFVEKFKEDIPRYMIKHQVRPGITGWAQVNGYRGDTSIEGRIEHDLYYIENWTFSFDIRIIFLTLFKGFVNKNAY